MRRPIRNKGITNRSQVTRTHSFPAPIGGLNARDSIANMDPRDAITLKNFFPTTLDCEFRGGYAAHATTLTGTQETLAVYNRMNGTNAMFSASSSDIYSVTSAGAGVDQSLTVTNGRFQWINFGDGTNNWLIMVNGTDSPKYYNGSSWVEVTGATSPALTGSATPTSLIHVTSFHGRLIFLEKSSLSFHYLSAGAAGGALTEFDLASFATKGGYLLWAETWSHDGGEGPDDYICFMTSEGQALIYRGTDPSSATTWVKLGTYDLVGRPLGRRSYIKYEGDILVLTQSGIFPLSEALKKSQTNEQVAITHKIDQKFNKDAQNYGSNFGWQMVLHPLKTALIVNVPVSESGRQKQYVMNTITKAWCEFDGWGGSCFAVFNDELYFGASTVVEKAWTGTDDKGDNIEAEGRTAYNYFGSTNQTKRANLFRPLLQANGSLSFLTEFSMDFSEKPITGVATYTTPSTSLWNTAVWGQDSWVGSLDIIKQWTSPSNNVGYCMSCGIKITNNSLEIHWVANDIVYETGGVIG